jgi:hypothetical protein
MLVATDFDAAPDLIASDLSENHMSSWIFDQPGRLNRNVLVSCLPKARRAANKRYMTKFSMTTGLQWTLRRPRRPSYNGKAVVIDIAWAG